MQFRDLKTQYQVLKEDIDEGMQEVLDNCNFISGNQVAELEEQLADYVGVKHCISCANGTDALSLALMAWGIGENDAVFVPDFTFFSSGEVVSFEGAIPIFVDVEKETFNMSPSSLREAIEKVVEEGKYNPKAIVAVDLFGQPADFVEITMIAKENNLLLLEDGAQGFGGEINDKKACSFGDIATTSFFPAKPLGCYGDGGAIFTNNDEWASLLRSYRVHGKGDNKYDNIRIGMNSRLDTLQAAVLKVKLKAFEKTELQAVNQVASWYTEQLTDFVVTPTVKKGFLSSWAQYSILLNNTEERNGLQSYLKEQQIPSMIYYPKAMSEQQAFTKDSKIVRVSCSKDLCARVLALPMHPYMTKEMVLEVTEQVKRFFSR